MSRNRKKRCRFSILQQQKRLEKLQRFYGLNVCEVLSKKFSYRTKSGFKSISFILGFTSERILAIVEGCHLLDFYTSLHPNYFFKIAESWVFILEAFRLNRVKNLFLSISAGFGIRRKASRMNTLLSAIFKILYHKSTLQIFFSSSWRIALAISLILCPCNKKNSQFRKNSLFITHDILLIFKCETSKSNCWVRLAFYHKLWFADIQFKTLQNELYFTKKMLVSSSAHYDLAAHYDPAAHRIPTMCNG